MSTKSKKAKNAVVAVNNTEPEIGALGAAAEIAPARKKKVSQAVSNNESAKSKLAVVIDILTYDDQTFDEQTMRHNVQIAVKHLQAVKDML